jgi:N6-L-threonylcarbamoyladenine synthase
MRSLVLGMETSCDETAAAVVRHEGEGDRVLSSVVASQDVRHAPFGGVVPEVASRAHAELVTRVVARAMADAGAAPRDLAGIAVTNRPGLLGSLLVGLTAAKTLALAWDLPMVAVHHLEAHLYATRWAEGVRFPMAGLVASGGHTSLYLCESFVSMRRVGATTDDAAGEAFDKVAKLLGLGYPGGPAIEKAASSAAPETLASAPRFPRSRVKGRPWDFTFSGLKTAVLYHVRGVPPADGPVVPRETFPAVARAFEEAAVDMLVTPTVEAALALGAACVTAAGGVAANSRLRSELARRADEAGLACAFAPKELCTDNAAMVAGRGWHDLAAGVAHSLDVDANARPERAAYSRTGRCGA